VLTPRYSLGAVESRSFAHIVPGKILRMTIPKSQGKQPYYDARKSAWGDIFPHEPKNTPQERYVPPDGRGPVRGSDIGKRGVDVRNATDSGKDSASYRRLAEELKRKKTDLRRARRQPQLNDD
jgi:ribosomal protein RSM22 (predicted rRNA methylase)